MMRRCYSGRLLRIPQLALMLISLMQLLPLLLILRLLLLSAGEVRVPLFLLSEKALALDAVNKKAADSQKATLMNAGVECC